MKLKKIFSTAFLFSGIFFGHSQNVASTANLTSGGLEAGTGGTGNTFYGYRAGKNTTGLQNTFIGNGSGEENTSGVRNVFIGIGAGLNNITGNDNIFLGYQAGNENYSGIRNTIIGNGAGSYGNGSYNVFIGNGAGETETGSNKLYIHNNEAQTPLIWGDFALNQLKLNGKVGIGNSFANFPNTAGAVNVANYNLFVKGGILTEEVRVSLQSAWADYVFSKEYNLKTLDEVASFINQNGHLPNMPSARQVKEEGIELGEIAKLQQEKIEELTLYVIQLSKENQEEKEQNKALLQKLSDLEEKVNLLLKK